MVLRSRGMIGRSGFELGQTVLDAGSLDRVLDLFGHAGIGRLVHRNLHVREKPSGDLDAVGGQPPNSLLNRTKPFGALPSEPVVQADLEGVEFEPIRRPAAIDDARGSDMLGFVVNGPDLAGGFAEHC